MYYIVGGQRSGAADYAGPVPTNQRVELTEHNMERPVQYEYSNEPEDEDQDGDRDSLAAQRNYVNELILQRSRNRHPAFSDDRSDSDDDDDDDDDDIGKTTKSTVRTPSAYILLIS